MEPEPLSASGLPPVNRRGWIDSLRRALTIRRGALLFALLAAVAFIITVALFYPGFMSRDSGVQLRQARSGLFTDHHPVVMAMLWRQIDHLIPGQGGMFLLDAAFYWVGLAAVCWALPGPAVARVLALAGVGSLLPPLCCLAGVWKDSFMHTAMLCGIACTLLLSARRWPRYVLAALFFVLAIAFRHNGAAAVWPLAIPLLIDLPRLAGRARGLRLLVAGGLSLALTFGVTVTLQGVLAPLARAENFWQRAAVFDLAAMSVRTGQLLIDRDTGVMGPGIGLDAIRVQFRPDYNDTLYYCGFFAGDECVTVFQDVQDPKMLARLRSNWIREIRAHPRAYLAQKADMAARLLRLGHLEPKRRYFYVDKGPLGEMATVYKVPDRTERILGWFDLQQTWPGYSAWIYLAISLLMLPFSLLWYLRGGPLLPLVYTASGLSYLLSVFLTAGGPDNRYTVWTILCTALAVVWAAFSARFEQQPRQP